MNNLFDANTALIQKCKEEITKFNEYGYVTIKVSESDFKTSKKTNELSKIFNSFMYQRLMVNNINEIINSFEFSIDDISVAIDRSPDSVLQIYSGMNERISLLKEYTGRILENLYEIKNFMPELDETFLDQLYEHMEYMEFIPISYEIIKKMKIVNKENVKEKINDLKSKLFKVNQDQNRFNKLQTFNIIPDDGSQLKLKDALELLFNLKLNSDKLDLKQLLKLITADTGVQTGLIINLSSNEDKYIDLSSLTSNKLPNVVNASMIEAYNIIKTRTRSKKLKDEVMAINIDNDNALVFVMWTHDMEYFKIRKTPLLGSEIKKILRQAPSKLIESINNTFQEDIIKKINNSGDLVNYKSTKYMAFKENLDEKTFLEKLKKNIKTNLKHNKNSLRAVLNACDSSKFELGILTPHAKLIYASMATKLAIAVEKHMIINKKINDEELHLIIFSNDNIYTRTMASYYLEQS